MKIIETSTFASPAHQSSAITELFNGDAPEVIYPEIRAITANKVTRNKTYYSVDILRGDPKEHTGVVTWVYPYPKPIIRDHATGGGMFGGASSNIYGRVKYARLIERRGRTPAYVSVIPEITDKEAIENILSGRFLTVSIGIETKEVRCSICKANIAESECEHIKGNIYNIKGKEKLCYWEIGPLQFDELSFVTVPSDDEAQVINPNTEGITESIEIIGGMNRIGEFILESSIDKFNDTKLYVSKLIESADDDSICTLGDLYCLDEDDPDYETPDEVDEKALTKKTRDALPDSAFCGPNRSFPAHDLAHAVQGLRMLGRYKGPGNKDKIRACLLRKAAAFRKRGDKLSASGYLVDQKHLVEYPLFPLLETNIDSVLTAISESNFSNEQKDELKAAVAQYCDEHNIERPLEIADAEPGDPVVIELNKDTYPILYYVLEAMETYILEVTMNDKAETAVESVETLQESTQPTVSTEVEEPEKVESDSSDSTAEVTTEAEETIQETQEPQEGAAENVADTAEPDTVVEAAASNEVEETTPVDKSKEYEAKLKESMALAAALMMTMCGRATAKDKSIDQLCAQLSTRTIESLNDTIEDLKTEINAPKRHIPEVIEAINQIDITQVEKVHNPILESAPPAVVNGVAKDVTSLGYITSPVDLDESEDSPDATNDAIQKTINERAEKIQKRLNLLSANP